MGKAFRTALPRTSPVCISFFLLALSYGVLMGTRGFSFLWPMCMSAFIFTGSMEFVTVNLLVSAFNPFVTFMLAVMLGTRHLFYGISMLGRFKNMGAKKPYLIFSLCDETFAIDNGTIIADDVDRGWHSGARDLSGGVRRRQFHDPIPGRHARHVHSAAAIPGRPEDRQDGRGERNEQRGQGDERMMIMTTWQGVITIIMAMLGTMLTRFLPFLLFPESKEPPRFITYLGTVLPYAMTGLLVVYSLKGVHLTSGSHGIPELLAIIAIALLHIWKRNMLLSIAGGTAVYMLLVQLVFS